MAWEQSPMWWRRRNQADTARVKAERANARGLRLSEAGRLTQAVAQFEAAVAASPSLLDARVNLGSAYYRLAGNCSGAPARAALERAADHFRYVLGLQPDHATALLNLAATLNVLGQPEEARQLLEDLARTHPAQRDVHYNLAIAYYQASRLDDCRREAQAELARDPDHPLARALVARLDA